MSLPACKPVAAAPEVPAVEEEDEHDYCPHGADYAAGERCQECDEASWYDLYGPEPWDD
ncbi:MAG: hypothetical protein KGL39_31570 [Patescibacteria group bacterium]|nr:hypothetical protein [Patescibacteria group bacterium]